MRPRGRKAETDDGTDKRPVLLSTSTGRPSYFDHTNLETRPQMRRRPMGLSALLLLTHHGHGLNNRGRLVDEVQLDASCALWADDSWRPTAPKSPAAAAMALPRAP
jgi:hypothetical protein